LLKKRPKKGEKGVKLGRKTAADRPRIKEPWEGLKTGTYMVISQKESRGEKKEIKEGGTKRKKSA